MTTTEPTSRTQALPALDQRQRDELDAAIIELASGAERWASTPLPERAGLLGAVHAAMTGTAQEWTETAAAIKGLHPSSQLVGEEWISGPYAGLAGAGTLAHSIAALAAGTSPLATSRFGTAPGGRVTIPVLPTNGHEWLLLHGFSAEVWMSPGRSDGEVRASAGPGELTPTMSGGVGLVLGAGNITSISPLDVLYEIVANNRSVLLKLNPVMAGMKSVFDKALAPLIDFGVLRIVQGAGDVGSYLTQHAGIAHVHITGVRQLTMPSSGGRGRTQRAVRRQAARCWRSPSPANSVEYRPSSSCRVTGRSGICATRPSTSSPSACTMAVTTASPARWLWSAPTGPKKKRSSPNSDGHLRSPLNAAVALAHDEFVGTLGANLIVDPKVIRQLGTGVLDAIARLRYDTIAINAWTGLGFLTATASWGALPGATVDNVQSGIGTVHNALLIDRPERTIVRGPFRPFPRSFAHGEFPLFPKPPWFVQARSAATAGRRLAGFAAGPSWLKMPAIFLAAFRA